MKAQRTLKLAALYSTAVALILAAVLLTASLASPASMHSNTGQALLLRSLLHLKTAKRIYGANPFSADGRLHYLPNGRFQYGQEGQIPQVEGGLKPNAGGGPNPNAGSTSVLINEAVQTYDVFLPVPAFSPEAGELTSTNLTPVWTSDGTELIYSSNDTSDGNYHLFAISASGGTPVQLTSGPGNEYYPVLSPSNNTIAFTSDALTPTSGVQNLFVMTFDRNPSTPTDVSTLTGAANSQTLGDSASFINVRRPSWLGETVLVFSAKTVSGSSNSGNGHYHIYSLTRTSGTFQLLTDGVEDDDDAALAPDGEYIAFTSNASSFGGGRPAVGANVPQYTTSTPFLKATIGSPYGEVNRTIKRGIFLITISGLPSIQVKSPYAVNAGPSWAFNSSATEFQGDLAFSGAALGGNYDISYVPVLNIASDALINQTSVTPIQLNTSDAGNKFDDLYPAFAPPASVLDISYQSNRSITFNNPTTNAPQETPTSLARGSSYLDTLGTAHKVGADYEGIFVSQSDNVDPPTLLNYSSTAVVGVSNGTSATKEVTPTKKATLTVRLSNRESGIDDDNIWVQIKDPDSKYQDSQGLEHKVFVRSGNPNAEASLAKDSGDAASLYQGDGVSFLNNSYFGTTGLIGGMVDNNNSVTVGTQPAGLNAMRLKQASGDPYVVFGQEYEAQFIKPSTDGSTSSDYGTPFYLAGLDDQTPHSGLADPPRTAEWLQLTKSASQDGKGGVLYTVSWTTPAAPSDFYADVIAYDKATTHNISTGAISSAPNWRIYDNVGGFTTLFPFNSSNGILVVNDNALGQKFSASTFGGSQGIANIVPRFYGAESYYTDIDVSLLPNAVDFWAVVAPSTVPQEFIQYLTTDYTENPALPASASQFVGDFFPSQNGLGVGSYVDNLNNDNNQTPGNSQTKGAPTAAGTPTSQRYDIWRVLSRGPIDANTLKTYEPNFETQPAVNDPGGVSGVAADSNVPNATKCVLWISPYAGDLLVGPGSIIDPAIQTELTSFMAAGGRLFVSGQDVAKAVGQNSTGSTFLNKVLNAAYVADSGGDQMLTGAAGDRISGDAFFNASASTFPVFEQSDFREFDPPGPPNPKYVRPNGSALFLSNDYVEVAGLNTTTASYWRTDASPDQIGPVTFPFGGDETVGHIDSITAQNGATSDITFSNGNGPGLLYHEDTTDALGSGFGSRSIFASFGLEGISQDYYERTVNSVIFYPDHNKRTNILHNIVNYLRTGTFLGKVVNSSNSPIQGAIVYAEANDGTTIPGLPAGRQVFSATTDSGGNYRIDGAEPGFYVIHAYANGYSSSATNIDYGVEGDTTTTIGVIQLGTPSPGTISGLVNDTAGNPFAGATVTFTSSDKQHVYTAITAADGTYTISNVIPGSYTGVATYTNEMTATSNTVNVTVSSGSNVTAATMVLQPQQITGTITDSSTGQAISGVSVSFKSSSGTVTSTSTDTSGHYQSLNLLPGIYTVTASATGYVTLTKTDTITDKDTKVLNFSLVKLSAANAGTVGGLIENAATNAPIAATITITDSSGAIVATLTASTKTTSPTAPNGDGKPLNYSIALPATSAGTTYTLTVTYTTNGTTLTAPTQTVTVKQGKFTRADFTGVSAPTAHIFPAGYNFFSLPYDYTGTGATWDSLFGASNRSHVAVWAPDLLQYLVDPTPPVGTGPVLGQGYWVKLSNSVGLATVGVTPVVSSVSIGLKKGWNQIGVPSLTAIKVSALQFSAGTSGQLTFDQAVSSQYHLIMGTLYRYDGTAYQPVVETDNSPNPRDTTLKPYQAYWIFAYANTTIIIPTHG